MNTKELIKNDVPEYILQPNVISQSIYSLGVNARRLIAMAMSLISEKEQNCTVSFSVQDFIKAVGLPYGGDTKKYIKAAVEECLSCIIKINLPNGDWVGYTWFTESRLSNFKFEWEWGWDKITMKFNPELWEAIRQLKKAYAKLDLINMGKLQSRYALRFYEMAMSYSGFAGKDGNAPGAWWFELSLEDIKIRFAVDAKKYLRTANFRTKVIDNPIEEINAAHIGLRIEPAYIRRGKRLLGARFNCRFVKDGEPLPVTAATDTGKEDEELISKYPDLYNHFFDESKKSELPGTFDDYFHRGRAITKLREHEQNLPLKRS
jgi:plasmid replication initiation protein